MDILKSEIYVMLMNMTKDVINDYRKLLECDVKSNLNKSDMAAGVARYIEQKSEHWLRRIPTWELEILTELVALKPGEKFDGGCQPMPSILEQLKLMKADHNPNNLHVLYSLTPTMHKSIKAGINNAFVYVTLNEYAQLDQFVMGVMNKYGIIPKDVLASYVYHASKYIEKELGDDDADGMSGFFYVQESLLINYNTIDSREGIQFVYHPSIEPSVESLNTILSCPKSIKYKKFSTDEFFAAGYGYPYITAGIETDEGFAFIKMLEKFTASPEHSKLLFCDIYAMLQEENEEGLTLLDLSFSEAKHISAKEMEEYRIALQAYKEVMPRWDLRGHSISEIRGTRKKTSAPMMPNPFDYVAKKVDPNQPCPCGSGKKYKDCHGRLS